MDAALASLDLDTLKTRRTEALNALHRLAMGDNEVSVNMDGVQVTYTEANQKRLESYVNRLQSAITLKERGSTVSRAPLFPGTAGTA